MVPKDGKFVLGTNRGPFLTPEDGNESIEKVDSAGGRSLTRTPTRTEKFRRHWRRFWLFYCIANVIFLAIFLPIFFLIAIPAIAQLVVNKSDLWLINAVVNEPKPDSVILTLQAKVNLKLAVPARIEAVTFHLFERQYGVGDAYADVAIPGQTIKGNHTLGATDQFTPLQNMTAWEKFVEQVVFQEKTTLSLKGETNAYLGVLKSHVKLDKDITSPTLNQFKGFSISGATLLLPPRADGTNLIGNTTLPNPTVLHLQVGTLNLDIKSGDLVIGNASLHNVTLEPGDNTFPLQGILDLKSVIGNISDVITAEASSLRQGNLTLHAVTTSVVWNGTEVPYYTDILRTLTLTTSVQIGDILKNTLRYLKQNSNVTSALSSIKGSPSESSLSSLSSLASRSEDKNSNREPVELAGYMKQSAYIRNIFRDVEPRRRDTMIESIAAMYPVP